MSEFNARPDASAPYRDASLSAEKRTEDLLSRMTFEEKVGQLCSVWLMLEPDSGEFAPFQGFGGGGIAHEKLVATGVGQITRPFGSRPVDPADGLRALAAFQRRQVEETRLGIPAIAHEECLTGFMAEGATQFPSPLSYGATWNPELIERVGDTIRRQMRAAGTHQGLAPVADVIRDARWGRVEECVAEDPYLIGSILTAYVRGLQGDDIAEGIIATLKHFAGYAGSEGGRNTAPTHVGPREMADVHLVPFEMAIVEGGARSVMNAYQENDGVPCAASHELLTETLRDKWGFEGFVVADYFAVHFLHRLHRVAADAAEASARSLSAGLDVELPFAQCFEAGLPEALERGLIDEACVDRAVRRHLRQKFELGLFERPYGKGVGADGQSTLATGELVLERPEDLALARRVAEESITLLANDGVLPLATECGKVAVIGPNADNPMALFGNYSFQNHVASHFEDHPLPVIAPTILADLRARLGEDRVRYAPGCEIMSDGTEEIAPAADLARDSDVAILVIGDKAGHFRSGSVGEGTDTDDLSLPGAQKALVDAVLESGTPTIIVLVNGRPFAIPGLADRCGAILEAWFPGQDGAAAIGGALFGELNPGGKLTVSFNQSAGMQPRFYNHKPSSPGFTEHPKFAPVFPFGHGLSYTTFEYADLDMSAETEVGGSTTLTFSVTNTGSRAGDEIVQIYTRDEVSSVTRPVKELKAFKRVSLAPGETKCVRVELSADLYSFMGIAGERIIEPGEIALLVGSSSEDIRLEGKTLLTGSVRVLEGRRQLSADVTVETVGAVEALGALEALEVPE